MKLLSSLLALVLALATLQETTAVQQNDGLPTRPRRRRHLMDHAPASSHGEAGYDPAHPKRRRLSILHEDPSQGTLVFSFEAEKHDNVHSLDEIEQILKIECHEEYIPELMKGRENVAPHRKLTITTSDAPLVLELLADHSTSTVYIAGSEMWA